MNKTEYILTPDGRLFKETVSRTELAPTQAMMDSLSVGAVRKFPLMGDIDGIGRVGVALENGGACYISAIMPFITLIAPIAKDAHTGNFTPNFSDREASSPCATFQCPPPGDMALVYMVRIDQRRNCLSSWFFAYDPDKRTWRLPLPNISEDCTVCLGQNPIRGETCSAAYKTAYETFKASRWNSDFLVRPEIVNAFWQFKPVDTGFEWVIPDRHWTEYCTKVANVVLENAAV